MSKRIEVTEHAGFCFGAGRGVETLEKSIDGETPIYTYGPILNNAHVVSSFEKKGVKVINSLEELKDLPKGRIIIRAHGIPKATYEILKASGFEIIDATCPFVKRIHKIVEKQSAEGDRIVVIGNPRHPEVEGIVGWCTTPATVIENLEEAEAFTCDRSGKICIVSQTTFNLTKFQELVEIFRKNSYNVTVMNTICDATAVRQAEARDLSKRADLMLVIGDTHSSNTKKLYEICKANCDKTFFVETVDDLKSDFTKVSGLVGITAGASTPKNIIEEVQNYVRNDF